MLSDLSIAYLFLGGSGAGCAFVCSVIALESNRTLLARVLRERFSSAVGRKWSRFLVGGFGLSTIFIILGSCCLLADLGQPSLLLALFFSSSPSWITFGTWVLALCLGFCLAAMLLWLGVIPARVEALKLSMGILALLSLAVMVYTGLLLADIRAVPLWNSAWLIALFFLSSLSCGIALLNVSALISRSVPEFSMVVHRAAVVDTVVILIEIVVLTLMLISVKAFATEGGGLSGNADDMTQTAWAASDSFGLLMFGDLAGLFWVCVIGVGLVIPLMLNMVAFCVSRAKQARVRRAVEHAAAIAEGADGTGIFDASGEYIEVAGSRSSMVSTSRMYIMLISSVSVLLGGAVLRYVMAAAALHPVLI